MASLEHIRTLVDELSTIAPWWQGWSRPLADGAIQTFERAHAIELWPEHRTLLETVGDHAPLPTHVDGALVPLAEARESTSASEFLGPLASPFLHVGDTPIEVAWDDAKDDFADPQWLPGCLPIAGAGCGIAVVLVVTGPDRGRVWSVTPDVGPELHPSGLEFAEWYAKELDRGLVPVRERAATEAALEARLASDPDDLDAAAELGAALVHRDSKRASTLLARAWAGLDTPAHADPAFARAVAEFDLVAGRSDRIAALDQHADLHVRCYVAIAAIRAGGLEGIDSIEPPASLRSLVHEHRAIARARSGDLAGAIDSLRRAPPSRRIVELRATLFEASGDLDAAAQQRARLGHPRRAKPHAPTLLDRLPPLNLAI